MAMYKVKVKYEAGDPVIGAGVQLLDADKNPISQAEIGALISMGYVGGSTDVSGSVTFNDATSVWSRTPAFVKVTFVGMETKIVPAGSNVTVTLNRANNELKEVVITDSKGETKTATIESNGNVATVKFDWWAFAKKYWWAFAIALVLLVAMGWIIAKQTK